MRCPLGGCDNEKNVEKLFALGQWGFTAGCATRYVCNEVGVSTSTYVVGYYWSKVPLGGCVQCV